MIPWLGERSEVKKTLEELRKRAESYSLEDITTGEWIVPFIGDSLVGYTREVDEAHFARKYRGESNEAIIERRIERAKRHAAIEGALMAGAVTAAVAATIASGGSASLVTLPAGVVVFVTDLLFSTRLQLRLAYDISVLSGHPVNLDEQREVRDLLKVALGERPEEGPDLDVDDGFKDTARRAVRTVTEETLKMSRKALSYIGRQLFRKALIKLTLPAASIPISSAMNYYSAGRTAKQAKAFYVTRARAREAAPKLAAAGDQEPRLLLEALWVVLDADERTGVEESRLLEEVKACLDDTPEGALAVQALDDLAKVRESDVLQALKASPPAVREGIYEAVVRAARFEHEISKKERAVLARLASACEVPFNLEL